MIKNLKIIINGDYIDSFVYSGVLFLIDTNLILHTYSWDDIFRCAIQKQSKIIQISLLDFAKGMTKTLNDRLKIDLELSENDIEKFKFTSTPLNVWPSDFNIFKNRVYISSEHGVDAYDFNWSSGSIESFNSPFRMFDEMSFKLATNTLYRIAIAAGKSGVISVIPTGKKIKSSDIKQIINIECSDCQWHDDLLIANGSTGHFTASFDRIPKQNDFSGTTQEYWSMVNRIKVKEPTISSENEINGSKIVTSWFCGKKIFKITENKKLYLSNENNIHEELETNAVISTLQYLRAQTAPFGTIIEAGDNIHMLSENSIETIEYDATNWRLFPKSKNYLNHLHIIKDDYISINIMDTPQNNNKKFGYSDQIEISD